MLARSRVASVCRLLLQHPIKLCPAHCFAAVQLGGRQLHGAQPVPQGRPGASSAAAFAAAAPCSGRW